MSEHEILPFDTGLEEHVIGCMILDPNCIGELLENGLKPKHFYHEGNAKFCQRLYDVWQEDPKKVDLSLLAPSFPEFGYSISRVVEIVGAIPTAANVAYYAEQVKQLAVLRAAVKVGAHLQAARTLRDPKEIRQAISKAEDMIGRLSESQARVETMYSARDMFMAYHETLDHRIRVANERGGVTGLATGYGNLDWMLKGLHNSELYVIAARPSVGKTALALNIARNISLGPEGQPGEPGLFFSLEMDAKNQLAERFISAESKIDQSRLRTGLLINDDWERYTMALGLLSDMNLVIDDGPGATVSEIKAKARKVRRERGLKYIIIDYLGLIRGEHRDMSRYDVVSENTRELKALARELDIPVIVLCQLSRSVEQRQDKRPMLSDLRESGEIEQTADTVMFLYRDDYYDKNTENKNIVEVIIAKQRNGPTGTVNLAFLKQFGKFADLYHGDRIVGEDQAI